MRFVKVPPAAFAEAFSPNTGAALFHDKLVKVDAAVQSAGVRPAPSLDVSVSVAASFTL